MSNLLQKVISALLCIALLCAALCFNAFAVGNTRSAFSGVYGDVDGNGSVNSNDALCVLVYSVGNAKFTEQQMLAADVNADGNVNSADALNILQYSVGTLTHFKAEEQNKQYDSNQGLAEFSDAINAVGSRLPSYLLREKAVDNADSITLSGAALEILPQSKISELEQSIQKEYAKNQVYTTIVKQSTTTSAEEMIKSFTKSNVTLNDLKSVSVAINENGNKIINISFKDEKNPSENSPIVKIFGMESYSKVKDELSQGDFAGLNVKVESLNLWYKNATLSCEFNSDTSELIALSWSLETVSESKVSTSYMFTGFSVEVKLSSERGETFSNFGY